MYASSKLSEVRLVQWVNHVSPNPDGRQSASYVKRFLPCPHTDPAHSKLVEHLMSPRRREKNVHLLNGKTRTKKDHILTCDTYLINPQVLHVPSEFKNPSSSRKKTAIIQPFRTLWQRTSEVRCYDKIKENSWSLLTPSVHLIYGLVTDQIKEAKGSCGTYIINLTSLFFKENFVIVYFSVEISSLVSS